jgi:2-polyprenyl-3-methyl-5-hydroxy-6-metoxy-1,4-benzoquinol methylase
MKCICCESRRIISTIIGSEEYYKCSFCGLVFISREARNNRKNIVFEHYRNIDPHERVAASKQLFYKSTLDYLSTQVKNEKRSILDVGCGFGYFLEFASRNGWIVSGVEIVDPAVQSARKRVGGKNIFHGSLKEAQYSEGCFDAITLWDVLVMVDSPFEELKECYRILKRRGKIGIRVRNVFFQKMTYKIYFPFRNVASWLNVRKPYVFHRYNFHAKSLRLLLERAGFSSIQITNSLLTEGDPYSHTGIDKLTSILKFSVDVVARVLFPISRGRLITGPSLLVWAEKL